jgi:hypothetical protein
MTIRRRIFDFFLLSCITSTELMERSLYMRLSRKERLQARLHRLSCKGCVQYFVQTQTLHQALHAHFSEPNLPAEPNDALENRILAALDAEK